MPMLEENTQKPCRIMLYGVTKARKTMWAGTAALAGFRCLVLDGDDGSHVLRQLPDAARKRVAVLNMSDKAQGYEFLNALLIMLEGRPFAYNETTKQIFSKVNLKYPGNWFVCDGFSQLTTNDVIIIDSWSALTTSMFYRYAASTDAKVDMADIARFERDAYAWMQNSTKNVMASLHHLPCHIIVIAHEVVHEKYIGEGKNRTLDFSRIQPAASSNNTSRLLGQHFSDIFRFTPKTMVETIISTGGRELVEGGSRVIAPATYKFDNYEEGKGVDKFTFGTYAKQAGYVVDPAYVPSYRFEKV